ncbi:MAG: glycoside hydrolase family 99-like domain-containing protein [Acidimicrobiales bacterium]|jgi:lipopolysaccharide biosynthesis protein
MEVLAFYLPQFHPIPENDRWWGPGFTEWTNVTKAQPLFRGHVQPVLPTELGFYDLRVPEVREQQAELARDHGVTGFVYWHYWFGGRKLLERPFDEVVASGSPDFPFCVAWANHPWSDTWMGGTKRVMLDQTYPGPEDHRAHFADLLPAFEDPRYIRIDGRPVLFVLRANEIPGGARFIEDWQKMAADAGLGGLYTISCGPFTSVAESMRLGYDGMACISKPLARSTPRSRLATLMIRKKLRRGPIRNEYADFCTSEPPSDPGCNSVPCVWPNWDDTPRRGRKGIVAVNSCPERFRLQVESGIDLARRAPAGEQILLVKSWNEWAEGNYLEPDNRFGRGWLEALARGLEAKGVRTVARPRTDQVPPR